MAVMQQPAGQLKEIVARIERLEEEKAATAADIKEVYAEAKGNGFDTKILRKVIRLRKVDRVEREEEEALLDVYMAALGMTPLEESAERREREAEERGPARTPEPDIDPARKSVIETMVASDKVEAFVATMPPGSSISAGGVKVEKQADGSVKRTGPDPEVGAMTGAAETVTMTDDRGTRQVPKDQLGAEVRASIERGFAKDRAAARAGR